MAEGVVVRLEAVEVEEHERPRLAFERAIELVLEIDEELAPVGEPRERIRQRLVAAGLQQLGVLAEAESRSGQNEHDRPAGENERERVNVNLRRGDEHSRRDEAAHDRRP